MKVQVYGVYYFKNHRNKDIKNYDCEVEVPDGLKEHEVLSLLTTKERTGFVNPLHRVLAKKDEAFLGVKKVRLASFVEKMVVPEDEGMDSIEENSDGKMVLSDEFGDLGDEVAPKKRIGRPKKNA